MKGFDAWVGSHGAKHGPVERAGNAAAADSDVSVTAQDSAVASDGATLTRAAIFLLSMAPSSGSSAINTAQRPRQRPERFRGSPCGRRRERLA
jgi:hypothetical protein